MLTERSSTTSRGGGRPPGGRRHDPWYVTRAGEIVAFAILTASICVGLTLSGRAQLRNWPRFALEDVHRFLGLLAGLFVAVHVAVLLFDDYLPFSPTQLLVPGLSP